jgi:hypothetical protein
MTRAIESKVRKDASTRPHAPYTSAQHTDSQHAYIGLLMAILHCERIFDHLECENQRKRNKTYVVIDAITGLLLDTRINHKHTVISFRMQHIVQALDIWKKLLVECKDTLEVNKRNTATRHTIAFHVMNIKPNNITRYLLLSKRIRNSKDFLFWIIRPPKVERDRQS